MAGKIIWPLAVAALLLAAALGGIWLSGKSDPETASVAGFGPEPGVATSQPRVLSPVDLQIASQDGDGPFQLAVGDELQLLASVELEDGSVRRDAPITWSSSDPQIATIDAGGYLRTLRAGEVQIEAQLAPLTANVQISVAG